MRRGLLLRGVVIGMEGWTTQWEIVIFVECRECNYKRTKTEKNWEQSFLNKEQLCNMWCKG